MDCSLPGSSVHGVSQAKVLEWVAIAFSRGSFQPREQTHISCIGRWILYHWAAREIPLNSYMLLLLSRSSRVRLCATPYMAAHQAPPSLGFSRQEHWRGLPFSSPMHESEKWTGSRSVVSDSSQPHGLQPTRLLRPWDFPGKSIGVGCHFHLRIYHATTSQKKIQIQTEGASKQGKLPVIKNGII